MKRLWLRIKNAALWVATVVLATIVRLLVVLFICTFVLVASVFVLFLGTRLGLRWLVEAVKGMQERLA